jgi:hypothetical protein
MNLHHTMATIYRKTAKGQSEIETRAARLSPRLRAMLILVDGRRNDEVLAKMMPGDMTVALAALLDDGFIEVAGIVDTRDASRPAAATSIIPPPGAASATPAAPAARPAATTQTFEQRRRDVVRALTDLLGPVAEDLAMRIEKCKDWSRLLPELQLAQKVVRNARGATAAADFGARFIDTPPG